MKKKIKIFLMDMIKTIMSICFTKPAYNLCTTGQRLKLMSDTTCIEMPIKLVGNNNLKKFVATFYFK